jgi:general secretion pathway protein N
MRWSLLAAGVAVYAAALVALAPATLIDARLQRASDGRIRLAGAQGSLWSGTGWIELRDAHGASGVAKHLAWRVLPSSLLRGQLLAEVELDQAKPFAVAISPSRIEIADALIDLPAAALGVGMPRLAALRLTGEVHVDIPHLSLAQGRVDGDATLQWRGAGSALTPISPLGAYEVRFKAVGPAMHAALRTLEGPLQLEGKGTWSNADAPSFQAIVRVPLEHREQLSPLLRLVAVERAAGRFELSSNKALGP